MGSARGQLVATARKLGMSPADYTQRIVAGEKWCTGCKAFHDIEAFPSDASRPDGRAAICSEARRARARARYVPKTGPRRYGPPPLPPRDGDKIQARQRINVLVRTGKLAHPNTLPCKDCGHLGDDRRHEYDHFLGYSAEHHLDVEPVCTRCHAARERTRRAESAL